LHEATILAQVAHVNVLSVIGICCQPPDLMLVMPYLARGSLHAALHSAGASARPDAAWRVALVAGIAHGQGLTLVHLSTQLERSS